MEQNVTKTIVINYRVNISPYLTQRVVNKESELLLNYNNVIVYGSLNKTNLRRNGTTRAWTYCCSLGSPTLARMHLGVALRIISLTIHFRPYWLHSVHVWCLLQLILSHVYLIVWLNYVLNEHIATMTNWFSCQYFN